jgi:formylglycine-generating enzyme required for sulfatase activity
MRIAIVLASLLLPAIAHAQGFGDYHGLVIGNDDYQHVHKLKTAVADARAVAKLLRESYGFRVTILENGTRRQIVSALNRCRKTLKATDNLLVYYAGHGYLDGEASEGYWLPVDASDDDDSQWISNATITTRLKTIRAKHVMVVSDSCYSGSLTRGISVRLRGETDFAVAAAKRARVVLTSGGLEPVEDSGGGRHSIFAKGFLDVLSGNTGILEGSRLFERVKPKVRLGSDQEPQYGSIRRCGHEEGGEFLFVRKGTNVGQRASNASAEAKRLRAELADLKRRQASERKAIEAEQEAEDLRRRLGNAKAKTDGLETQLAAVARASVRYSGTLFRKDGTSVKGVIRVTKNQTKRHAGVLQANGELEVVHRDDIARIEWEGDPPYVDPEILALEERVAAIAAEKEREAAAADARRRRDVQRRRDELHKRDLLRKLAAEEARERRERAAESVIEAQRLEEEKVRDAERLLDEKTRRQQRVEDDKARRVQQVLSNLDPACKRVEDLPRVEGYTWRVQGYTWLRNQTFSCAGQTHTLAVYRNDAFAQALKIPKSRSVYACEFVLIPGGTFSMGTLGESPLPVTSPRDMTVQRAFLMGRTEVTRMVWHAFSSTKREKPKDGRRPVEGMSWPEMQRFCKRSRVRLPTEMEWELACRAGSSTEFCFGDEESGLSRYGWYKPLAFGHAQKVATKASNAFGVFDMHGNVREWCQDSHGMHACVTRGGDWGSPQGSARSGRRESNRRDRPTVGLGFRPAVTMPK